MILQEPIACLIVQGNVVLLIFIVFSSVSHPQFFLWAVSCRNYILSTDSFYMKLLRIRSVDYLVRDFWKKTLLQSENGTDYDTSDVFISFKGSKCKQKGCLTA